MAGRIHAAAGIHVLEPGAASFAVLLDNDVGDARFLQLDRHRDAGQTGTDHHRLEALQLRLGWLLAPGHGAPVPPPNWASSSSTSR